MRVQFQIIIPIMKMHILQQRYEVQSKNQLKDFDSAIKDFTEAININPNSYFLNWRAYLKLQIDDIKGSIIDNTNAIKLDPTHTKSYLDRAIGKYQLGDLEGAISDYEAIIDFGDDQRNIFN